MTLLLFCLIVIGIIIFGIAFADEHKMPILIVSIGLIAAACGGLDIAVGDDVRVETFVVHNIENKQIILLNDKFINLNDKFDRMFQKQVTMQVCRGGKFIKYEHPVLTLIEE